MNKQEQISIEKVLEKLEELEVIIKKQASLIRSLEKKMDSIEEKLENDGK